MDLQPSQSNYNEGDRLQTSESLSGFFSRMTVSNKTMERIMRQDSNLSPYDGFRIGGIGRVLNQIGLNQRRHHIIYKVSSGEFAIRMELTGNVMEMQLIPKEDILEELSKLRKEVAVTMKWIHIGAIEVVIKATFKEGIDSEIHLSIIDRRINNLRDSCLGTMIENLYAGKLMFDIHPRIAYNLADQDFSRVLTLHQDFKRKDLMKEGNRPYSITYGIVYEGMLEIAGHKILVAGVAGKENGSMTLGLNFLEYHKPWGRKGRDFSQKILILNKGIREVKIMIGGAFGSPWFGGLIESDSFYEESEKEIINLKEALQEIKLLDISEESKLSLENVKRLIQRNFSENPLAWWDKNKIKATLKVKKECKYEYVRYKPIQMNMEDKKDMQTIIKEHIHLGLIEPGVSAYSSPSFLVRNHGEIKRGKPRLVINYQGINKILEFDGYYIPSREHLIDCIKGARVFSKLDYKSGFYQIKMESESKKFTAFFTPQ
ncbi:UNVERIFIED_CONTAM: movement protein [Sesamum latifolium]|uniref:Movement protein n=1 Tax=Sesamum latifolium TaxID=2727402 RepID=A0AAW2SQM8_9LAMI